MSNGFGPFNPTDPRSAAFYFTFLDDNGNHQRGNGGCGSGCGSGCGCLVLAFFLLLLLIIATNWR